MSKLDLHVHKLFTENGTPYGVFVSPEAWDAIEAAVLPMLEAKYGKSEQQAPQRPEPTADWEQLLEYWDFKYPVDMDVRCDCCGNETADWSEDEPRKFRLTSVNLGGLVSFHCQTCKAKIIKRHFKDEIVVECHPFQAEKDPHKEALHSKVLEQRQKAQGK